MRLFPGSFALAGLYMALRVIVQMLSDFRFDIVEDTSFPLKKGDAAVEYAVLLDNNLQVTFWRKQ